MRCGIPEGGECDVQGNRLGRVDIWFFSVQVWPSSYDVAPALGKMPTQTSSA